MPSCGTCRFFATRAASEKTGECVRYPPKILTVPVEGGQGIRCFFPLIDADRWCGEWQLKIEPVVTEQWPVESFIRENDLSPQGAPRGARFDPHLGWVRPTEPDWDAPPQTKPPWEE